MFFSAFRPVLPVGLAVLLFSAGCSSDKGDFVEKSEEQLAAMEKQNDEAHQAFVRGSCGKALEILNKLTAERTVSRPLYQLELLSVLLLSQKYDEAHELMVKLRNDFETLFDTKLEAKAQSVWHGEVNKVYKGDSYERSTFYALMALSFIRKGNCEDALRCVKNGLLAEADANAKKDVEDYSMLHYLGFLAAAGMGDRNEAEEYLRAMYKGLETRKFRLETPDGEKVSGHCFEALSRQIPNVLLVVWTGAPPTVVCLGAYREKRSIVHGVNVFDAMSVAVDSGAEIFVPNNLGNVDYQATTRGGRLMDNVLADKAAAKTAMKLSGNVLLVTGLGLMTAGSQTMNSPPVGISLLGAGACCLVVGGSFHLIGSIMNPAADARYWRNLPGEFFLVPLTLPPGKHRIVLTGYKCSDKAGRALFETEVRPDRKLDVIHLPMLDKGLTAAAALRDKRSRDLRSILDRANADRLAKEIR